MIKCIIYSISNVYSDLDMQGSPETCVFPFYYQGVKYDTCAQPDMYPNLGWCSFDRIFDGNYGYCTDDCKTKKLAKPNGGTCQATSIDCPPVTHRLRVPLIIKAEAAAPALGNSKEAEK